MSRTGIIAISAAAAVALGLVLLGGLLAWRLSRGPIELGFLTPHIAAALSPADNSYQVELSDTALAWSGLDDALKVRSRDFRIRGADGNLLASAPEIAVDLSLFGLMRGIVAPAAIEVIGAKVVLARTVDGGFAFAMGEDIRGAGSDPAAFFLTLLDAPGGGRAIARLEQLSVTDSALRIEDAALGRSWTARVRHIEIERDEIGIRGEGVLEVALGERLAEIRAAGLFERDSGAATLGLSFTHLDPAAVAEALPELAPLKAAAVALSGQLTLGLHADRGLTAAEFDVKGGAGRLVLPGLDAEGIAVEGIRARGGLMGNMGRLRVDELVVDLGAATFGVHGELDGLGTDEGRFRLDVDIREMPVEDLRRYWPADMARNSRTWVTTNLSKGVVRHMGAALDGRLGGTDGPAVESFSAAMIFDGMSVRYVQKLPSVTDVHGTATFGDERIDFSIRGGSLRGLRVTEGTVAFTGLDGEDHMADIEVRIQGPLTDVLEVIDHKPLGYVRAVGLAPGDIDGASEVELRVQFPLLDALTFAEIKIAAKARLLGARWRGALLGRDVSDGDVGVSIDNAGLVAEGTGRLGTIPIRFRWLERFKQKSGESHRVELEATLDDQGRAALGLGAESIVRGPIPTRVVVTGTPDGARKLGAELDLTGARVTVSDLGWSKEPGVTLRATLSLPTGAAAGREGRFEIAGGELVAKGKAALAANSDRIAMIELEQLRAGRNELKGVVRAIEA
ncbi:MAG: DUF3971 domain-containing protein, partial [Alphaproteobacteria bacterium]